MCLADIGTGAEVAGLCCLIVVNFRVKLASLRSRLPVTLGATRSSGARIAAKIRTHRVSSQVLPYLDVRSFGNARVPSTPAIGYPGYPRLRISRIPTILRCLLPLGLPMCTGVHQGCQVRASKVSLEPPASPSAPPSAGQRLRAQTSGSSNCARTWSRPELEPFQIDLVSMYILCSHLQFAIDVGRPVGLGRVSSAAEPGSGSSHVAAGPRGTRCRERFDPQRLRN